MNNIFRSSASPTLISTDPPLATSSRLSRLKRGSPLILLVLTLSCFSLSAHAQTASSFTLTNGGTAQEALSPSMRTEFVTHPRLKSAPYYQINVNLDMDLLVYKGVLTLTLKNQERDTLNALNFLLYPNTKELSGQSERRLIISSAEVDGREVAYDQFAGEVLNIPLPTPLLPGAQTVVRLGFKGSLYRLPDSASDPSKMGLEQLLQSVVHHREQTGGYGVFSYGEGIVSMALWHPLLVAYDEHGWDLKPSGGVGDRSYFDISHFDVTLTTSADALVATTGSEVEARRVRGERVSRYVAGGVREFTIQASKDYVVSEARVGDVRIKSYALAKHRESGEATLREAVASLRTFERLFGPYPYRELELAESPLIGGAGGVEFPGLVTIGSFLYSGVNQLKTKGISSNFVNESRDFVVAHEVAHQWWNAVVGSDSRRHPFVDEALANYSAAAHFHLHHGPAAARRQIDAMMRLNYHLARLTGMEDQPVDQPTSAFEGMLDYGAIVYGKGALFFWELRGLLGAERLHRGLNRYYEKYTFGIAKGDALRATLRAESPAPAEFDRFAKRWLDERHGDEDIDGVSIYQTLKIFMGDVGLAQLDPELRRWANHRGVDALAQMLEGALKGDFKPEELDYQGLTLLLSDLMEEDPEMRRWALVAGRVLSRPDAKPSDLLKEAGREIRKEDEKTGLILESMGLLLDALTMPDHQEKRPSKSPSTGP